MYSFCSRKSNGSMKAYRSCSQAAVYLLALTVVLSHWCWWWWCSSGGGGDFRAAVDGVGCGDLYVHGGGTLQTIIDKCGDSYIFENFFSSVFNN